MPESPLMSSVMQLVRNHWGFEKLRPMQAEAICAILAGRDSIVVLPTGGGKSLCYQAPALLGKASTVVVSPLISLMKDQVDALVRRGVPAALINSSLSGAERSHVVERFRSGAYKLVYVAPERFAQTAFVELLMELNIRNFVIDEAHCVSHWGHEFRPDYRQLCVIKQRFPAAAVHAYTATATPHVRDDIGVQLRLDDPQVIVGPVDRPNLVFRVEARRRDVAGQVVEILERRRGQAGIVYCLRRKDVDWLSGELRHHGFRVLPYHAGMTSDERQANQTAFSAGEADVIVATVAFGMGIDRANIRYIVHAHMPKSIEHYQQEVGRAGRDGLEAECVLLHSNGDAMSWAKILENSDVADRLEYERICERVEQMNRFCTSSRCRHAAIVEYFGQTYGTGNCGACDVCLDERAIVPDSLVVAQKILSCVARIGSIGCGAVHLCDVLHGNPSEKVVSRGHDRLSTFGLLSASDKASIRSWINQLVDLGHLQVSAPPYRTLSLTESAWAVMRGKQSVALREAVGASGGTGGAAGDELPGADAGLLESLRAWRRALGKQHGVAGESILDDSALKPVAAIRPSTLQGLLSIPAIGPKGVQQYGAELVKLVAAYCAERKLALDNVVQRKRPPESPERAAARVCGTRQSAMAAFRYFDRGAAIEEVMTAMKRARSTVAGYLHDYIVHRNPESIEAWVPLDVQERVVAARDAGQVQEGFRLKPVFEALSGEVSYDEIRLTLAHRRVREEASTGQATVSLAP